MAGHLRWSQVSSLSKAVPHCSPSVVGTSLLMNANTLHNLEVLTNATDGRFEVKADVLGCAIAHQGVKRTYMPGASVECVS